MGRDSRFRGEWTEEIQRNGVETHKRISGLLEEAEKDGVLHRGYSSGWRPDSVNDATANSSTTSRHKKAKAGDVLDYATRALQLWLVKHPDRLCKHELWMEHPGWCAKQQQDGTWVFWAHLQTEPPTSGKRIYIPSSKPIVLPLPGYDKPIPERIKL